MIVSELIEKLKQLPQDADLFTTWEGEICTISRSSPELCWIHATCDGKIETYYKCENKNHPDKQPDWEPCYHCSDFDEKNPVIRGVIVD